jgi:hypothetical protein
MAYVLKGPFCTNFVDSPITSFKFPMLCETLSPQHGASSGCGWRKWSPDMEGKDKGKGYSCPRVLTEHHAMKAYWGVEV